MDSKQGGPAEFSRLYFQKIDDRLDTFGPPFHSGFVRYIDVVIKWPVDTPHGLLWGFPNYVS